MRHYCQIGQFSCGSARAVQTNPRTIPSLNQFLNAELSIWMEPADFLDVAYRLPATPRLWDVSFIPNHLSCQVFP